MGYPFHPKDVLGKKPVFYWRQSSSHEDSQMKVLNNCSFTNSTAWKEK